MDIIDAERQSIQSERVKIETMARLKPILQQTQSQGDRSEIDAAVKIAQDVARQTGVEREKLIVLQQQCESERQELVNMKNTVCNKEHSLERSIKEATEQIVSNIEFASTQHWNEFLFYLNLAGSRACIEIM